MVVMQFTELKQHLVKGQTHPAYLVVGEDAFLRQSAVDQFSRLVTAVPELNLSVLTSPTSQAVVEAAESLPMLCERRVVLVRDYTDEIKGVLAYLDDPCPSTVLVFVCEKLSANFSKAMTRIVPVECDRLDNGTLLRWIAGAAKDKDTRITGEAANLLIGYCARNLTRISGELEKLAGYRAGGMIEAADVRALVTADVEVKIFELSDALGQKQAERVASVLGSLLQDGTPVVNLMGLLYAHFRRLLYCAVTPPYDGMAGDLGVKEFAVKKAREAAARYTPRRLKKICDSFHKADADFKSGRITDRMALDLFIMETLNT